ncbi:MAG: DUF1841 family protein [Casimicrobiaceae bacterium]|nr:DUF1841 family protein [Casimicrobiaceae bacterium]
MYAPTREQARRFLIEAWAKYRRGEPLSALEQLAVEIIARHPEYESCFADPERYLDRDWRPEGGETNPFLHVSLHLAIAEQLSIDQPPGIRATFQALLEQFGGDAHEAEHVLLEALAETLWQAQRLGAAPDGSLYLTLARARLKKPI